MNSTLSLMSGIREEHPRNFMEIRFKLYWKEKKWRLGPKDLPLFNRYMVFSQKDILKWKRTMTSESKEQKREVWSHLSAVQCQARKCRSLSLNSFSSSFVRAFVRWKYDSGCWSPFIYLFILNCKGVSWNIIKCCWDTWVQFRFPVPLLQYIIASL